MRGRKAVTENKYREGGGLTFSNLGYLLDSRTKLKIRSTFIKISGRTRTLGLLTPSPVMALGAMEARTSIIKNNSPKCLRTHVLIKALIKLYDIKKKKLRTIVSKSQTVTNSTCRHFSP